MEKPLAEFIHEDACPDCDGKGFLAGPSAGFAQNIQCANSACKSEFNVIGFPPHIIVERIGAKATPKQKAYDKRTDRKFNDAMVAWSTRPWWVRLFKLH